MSIAMFAGIGLRRGLIDMPTSIAQLIACLALLLFASPGLSQSRSSLITQNNSTITANGRGAITGPVLNSMLFNVIQGTANQSDANNFTGNNTHAGTETFTGGVINSGVVIDVRAAPYNAKCDGTTDDAAAINAALAAASANADVLIPAATCRAASTITEPPGVNLIGAVFNPGNPPTGSTILCDLAVSPCVKGGGSNGQARFEKLVIARAAGMPGSTTIGLQVADAYNAILTDVMVNGAGICYQFLAHPGSGLGLGAMMTRTYSGSCVDAHIDVNGWPELRIGQSRFGMNGGGDYAADAFMRFEGGVGGTAGGPNTVDVENSQFNQGSNGVAHWLEFVNLGAAGVPSIDATDFKFEGVHVEGISTADVYSDASWNILNRLNIANSSFNDNKPFFSLNAATQVSVVQLVADQIYGSLSLTGQTGLPISAFTQLGGYIAQAETLTGVVGSTATVSGVAFGNGLTVTGAWSSLSVGPDTYVNGNLTNTATGYVNVFEPTNVLINTALTVSTTATNNVENLIGVEAGSYVQQNILNNGGGAGSSARTQWQTSNSGGYAIFGVTNFNSSVGYAQFYAGNTLSTIDFLTTYATGQTTFHSNSQLELTLTATSVAAAVPVQVPSSTVAGLPSCAAGLAAAIAYVTDAAAPTYNAALTGGGAVKTLAMCNGSSWVAH